MPLRVLDRYADGAGRTEGLLLGCFALFHRDDADTARSAAGRAALESIVFAPTSVLPDRGVAWWADAENAIVARFDLPPEQPEVHVQIDEQGALRAVSALRWGRRRPPGLRLRPMRLRGPCRAPFRRSADPEQDQRRLVVRHAALRTVLPGRDSRHQPRSEGLTSAEPHEEVTDRLLADRDLPLLHVMDEQLTLRAARRDDPSLVHAICAPRLRPSHAFVGDAV